MVYNCLFLKDIQLLSLAVRHKIFRDAAFLVQRQCKSRAESPSLLERYAEMQLFLCKDNANRGQDKINSLIFNGFGCLIITPACLSYYCCRQLLCTHRLGTG